MNTFYGVYPWKSPKSVVESADALKGPTDLTEIILLMEENRHKLISSVQFIPWFTGFYSSQLVQDFFHQQYKRDN